MESKTAVASPLVVAIEVAWAAIQQTHTDVPEVVVTIGGGAERGGLKLGHFAAERWARGTDAVHELFVGGEGLQRGARAVMGTLLHEAAHAAAAARGVQDTSRQGRYHNGKFREIAESFGLIIEHDSRIGWSLTTMPDATADAYAAPIAGLAAAIVAYRRGFVPATGTAGGAGTGDDGQGEGDTKKPRNGYSLTCACESPRRIRISASTYEAGPILCGNCTETFTIDE